MKRYNAHNLAGCVSRRDTRQGATVSIYNTAQADLDGGPWVTVCEDHATIISHETLGLAKAHASDPNSWCESCAETKDWITIYPENV